MAKPARGLPSGFALDLPDERPVMIGDFLDEPPPTLDTSEAGAASQLRAPSRSVRRSSLNLSRIPDDLAVLGRPGTREKAQALRSDPLSTEPEPEVEEDV